MANEVKRTEQDIRERTDPRYFEIPQVCLHCKNLVSVGGQFGADGWTCKAFPKGILYGILTNETPHDKPFLSQEGVDLYDPKIYTEEHTGREWYYTADADWVYVDGGPK